MREETIAQLRKISVPKKFAKDDYICYEGQPGKEMYMILTGSVGIYITSSIGTLTQVATAEAGGFFGEMALFDNLPRSASCIALEDTIAIAVTNENLQQFLATCPDIAKQMLENLSRRIRKLNDDLYKNNRVTAGKCVPRFEIPSEYGFRHVVKEPYQDPKYFCEDIQVCPICGKRIFVKDVKRNILQVKNVDSDSRINYLMCDPLWYEVIACSNCHYTNHYLRFFAINKEEKEVIAKILEEEHKPVVEEGSDVRSEFDTLVMKYLQAIHINEHLNPEASAMLGGLWRNLYWLVRDSLDDKFAKYCAKKAADKYRIAIDENEFFDLTSKTSTALSLASLYTYCGETKLVPKYIELATQCPDERIKEEAIKEQKRLDAEYGYR